jgi:putative aldouronate transport system permease protein
MAIVNRRVGFWPVEFTLDAYASVFADDAFLRSILWTAFLTVVCTAVSMVMTILCAYPLTYDKLKGSRAINVFIILTMYFSAGTIPNYILMRDLNLLENPLVLVIPSCLSVFNMIILRSFFFGIHESLRESAELDGANPLTILVRIYLPLSTSVLATLALFYAVGRWNGFSDALLYITDSDYAPIQLKLYQIINNISSIEIAQQEGFSSMTAMSEGIKSASIIIATLPIVCVYPRLQRYFIAGVTIGAVKG